MIFQNVKNRATQEKCGSVSPLSYRQEVFFLEEFRKITSNLLINRKNIHLIIKNQLFFIKSDIGSFMDRTIQRIFPFCPSICFRLSSQPAVLQIRLDKTSNS
jgi:hypothetical protein